MAVVFRLVVSPRIRLTSIALVLAGIALAIGPSPAHAGDERQKWWFSDWARTDLKLTDQQARDIEAVFQFMLPRMRAEKEHLDSENAALSKLMVEGASEKAIGSAIERVEAARGAASKTRTWMLVRIFRVLTPEQRVKLQAKHEQRDAERRSGGGGPPK